MRYDDRTSLGNSKVVPFKKGEEPKDRHRRRYATAMELRHVAEKWAHETGVRLAITNGGHHWRFLCEGGQVEWWPSSAKLVFDREYNKGLHAHDVYQIIQEMEKRWTCLSERAGQAAQDG